MSAFKIKCNLFVYLFKFLFRNACNIILLYVGNLATHFSYCCCQYQFCLNFNLLNKARTYIHALH